MGISLLILPSIIYNHFLARFVTRFFKKMHFSAKFRSLAQKEVGQVVGNDGTGGVNNPSVNPSDCHLHLHKGGSDVPR